MALLTSMPHHPARAFLTMTGIQRRFVAPRARFWHPVHYQYALDDVTLSLNRDERVGLVGVSGAGKSTLLKILLGLETADDGQVFCQGQRIIPSAVRTLRWFRRQVQYVPQDPATTLAPHHTVAQAIAEPLRYLTHTPHPEAAVQHALASVALPVSLLTQQVSTLSGGQAQRVAIARALVLRPAFLIADEPVSGLDLPLRQQMTTLFTTLARQHNMGLLMVSHDISTVAALCQRVVVMHDGRIVEDRPLHRLLSTPSHPHTQHLLAAIPRLDGMAL